MRTPVILVAGEKDTDAVWPHVLSRITLAQRVS
jgi:hypothetical protein